MENIQQILPKKNPSAFLPKASLQPQKATAPLGTMLTDAKKSKSFENDHVTPQ